MGIVIDRRRIGNNTDVNLYRFYRRLKDSLSPGSFATLHEYGFYYGGDGEYSIISPGNDKWMQGDIIEFDNFIDFLESLMQQGTGGNDGNGDGELFEHPEYLNALFSNLKMPNLDKISSIDEEIVRSGYSTTGGVVDFMRTFQNSIGRRAALKKPLEDELALLKEQNAPQSEIEALEEKIKKVPFIDENDVRYKRYDKVIYESKKLLIILTMDASGSMGYEERNIAKLFSDLVIRFISKHYDNVAFEYILFTSEAHRVDGNNFFNQVISGGTYLSTAVDLQQQIIDEYDADWNKYVLTFSDTDILDSDLQDSKTGIIKMLKDVQGYIYCLTGSMGNEEQYTRLTAINNKFFRKCFIKTEDDVLNEFIKMFS